MSKSKLVNLEPVFLWILYMVAIAIVIAAFCGCQDPYEQFEEDHMEYFVTHDWISTDSTFALFFLEKDKLTIQEYGNSYNLEYSYKRNTLYVSHDRHYKVTGGLARDLYFITDYLGKRYELQNNNTMFPAN